MARDKVEMLRARISRHRKSTGRELDVKDWDDHKVHEFVHDVHKENAQSTTKDHVENHATQTAAHKISIKARLWKLIMSIAYNRSTNIFSTRR
ncbi:MAG: hypothetical protein WCG04_06920 [Alphaproteobacteria bacterium]